MARDYTRFRQLKHLLLYDAFPMPIPGKPDSKVLKEDALSRLKGPEELREVLLNDGKKEK